MQRFSLFFALTLMISTPAMAEQISWNGARVTETSQANSLPSLYQIVDLDHSGIMSAKEYARFKQVHDEQRAGSYLAYSFNGLDKNKDGWLTLSEFQSQRLIKTP